MAIKNKRVLITINPGLIDGKWFPTVRSLVSALDKTTDLMVATVGDYDFSSKKVRIYRRIKYGKFEEIGMVTPKADLWIVYSDGYWLDAKALGFKIRSDFFNSQIELHQYHLANHNVDLIVNSPQTEQKTLKSWFSSLDAKKTRIIPTVNLQNIDEVRQLRKLKDVIVAKLSWGGAMIGTKKLASDEDVDAFENELKEDAPYTALNDYCFQDYAPASSEKRFWIAGGKVVGARLLFGRRVPWETEGKEKGYLYDEQTEGYARDRAAVENLLKLSELTVGSVDFIGPMINEINGCGTVFTYFQEKDLLLDFRKQMVDSFLQILNQL